MPPPRPPSRIEPLTFPVFGISWFSEPSDGGRSIIAYCGGGGSAKTGVNNSVVIFGEKHGPRQISTGEYAGSAIRIYQNPISSKLWMIIGLGSVVRRYALDEEEANEDFQELPVEKGECCVAVTANIMASQIAIGLESGKIVVYSTSDDDFTTTEKPLYMLMGHTKAVCALDYASRTVGRLISSAKDGTACIWNDGQMIGGLRCSVGDPNQPPPKKTTQILVRGCAFGDMEGKVCYTVASARRGKAYLAQWEEQKGEGGRNKFVCVSKTACSDCPVSAMSLSADLSLLVLGNVEGSIILWSTETWKPIKVFPEVHHLPVTCIAARPFYSVPGYLQGEEEEGLMIHARSASADSQLACLTTQRRAARKKVNPYADEAPSFFGCSNILLWMYRLLVLYILSIVFSPVADEARVKCAHVWGGMGNVPKLSKCVLHQVLIAPSDRPGISSPIY